MAKKFIITITVILFITFLLIPINKETSSNKTKIKFSSWGSQSEVTVLKEILSNFEKENPDIDVEFLHIPENYFRKLHLLFAANTPPDIIFINNTYAPLYIEANLLENLNGKFIENDFYESAYKTFQYNNGIYAIPRDISEMIIYYNSNLFKKNNIKIPEENWTINDLENICKQFRKNDIYCLNFETNPVFWITYLNYFGGGLLNEKGDFDLLSPKSKQGLDFYAKLIQKKYIPSKSDMSGKTSAQMFINGELAMYLSGRWNVPVFRDNIKFNFDVINFPKSEYPYLIDASGYAIAKNSKHKTEALKLVNYLTSKEVSEKMTSSGLITPARIDVANSNVFLQKDEMPKNSQIFLSSLNHSKPTKVNAEYAKVVDKAIKLTEPILTENK